MIQHWKSKAHALKKEVFAVYLACKDPRVPLLARIIAICVAGYAFSPIDLIPDFIPVFGYLDDLILVPLGIALVLRMIPPAVMEECRIQAQEKMDAGKPTNWTAGVVIICIWTVVVAAVIVRLNSH